MPRQKNFYYYIFQVYKWLVYVPLLFVTTLMACIFVLLFSKIAPRFCNRTLVPFWSVLNIKTALSSVEVIGKEHIDQQQSYIIVANHLSHFDIFALYGWLGLDVRWVMKQELRKIPFFGAACAALGHIYVDRRKPAKAKAQLEEGRRNFSEGSSIIFFPEGTRSEDGHLKPFKKGAFLMAKQLQLPILPVVLVGTDKIVPAGSTDLYPGKAQVHVKQAISVDDVNSQGAAQLKDKAFALMDSAP